MSIITFIGKALIVASLLFQAYLLFNDSSSIGRFDKNLAAALKVCGCLSSEHEGYVREYLKLVIASLIASSVLIVALRWSFFKLTTLFGLALLMWVENHAVFTKIPSISILENTPLWHSVGVIGVIVYLLAVQSYPSYSSDQKQKIEKAQEKPTQNKRGKRKQN